MAAKHPKFYCQYCNAEVKQNDKLCHHCGRFFASVKCAACGYVGDAKQFGKGCPICGYAVYGSIENFTPKNKKSKNTNTDPLPLWMYVIPSFLLVILLLIIFFRQ